MNPREEVLELVRIGKHEDYFRRIYEEFDTLLENLQRTVEYLKSINDNSFNYEILKYIKLIEEKIKQIKEQDLKFTNESQVDKILKMIDDMYEIVDNTFKMLNDYIEQSEFNTN